MNDDDDDEVGYETPLPVSSIKACYCLLLYVQLRRSFFFLIFQTKN